MHDFHFDMEIIHSVISKVLTCGLKVGKLKVCSCYYVHFWWNILGKGINFLILPDYKYYGCCSATMMTFILNNNAGGIKKGCTSLGSTFEGFLMLKISGIVQRE